jgi:intracellular septation protein A
MKLLLDFLPILLFFGTFKFAESRTETGPPTSPPGTSAASCQAAMSAVTQAPVLLATVVVILATLAQVAWLKARRQKVDTMLWVSLGLVVVLGGATIYFQSETFIKWKPSALYWAMGLALWLSPLLTGKNLLKLLLGEQTAAAAQGLAPAQLRLDRLLRADGHPEPVGGLHLQHQHLGQLQAVRRHRPDAAVHAGAGPVPEQVPRRAARR